jgi:O-antigen/teichoic acid export membrane protein
MTFRRPVSVDTIAVFLTLALTQGFNFGTGILLARYLGPAGKGVFTLILLILGQAVFFSSFGVDIAILCLVGQNRPGRGDVVRSGLWLSVLLGLSGGSFSVFLIVFAFPTVVDLFSVPLVILAATLVPLGLVTTLCKVLVRLSGRIVEEGLLNLLGACFTFSFILFPSSLGLGMKSILAGCWASGVVLAVLAWWACRKWTLVSEGRLSWEAGKGLLAYGGRIHLGSVLQSLNYRLDMYLLSLFAGTSSLGIYSVAVGMGEAIWAVPTVFATVFMPRLSILPEEMRNELMGTINRLTSTSLLGCVVLLGVGATPLIRLVYGDRFVEASSALLFLLPGIWFLGLWKNFINDLSVRGKANAKITTSGITLLFSTALYMTMIPRWGIAGAAAASSLSYGVSFGLSAYLYCRTTRVSLRSILVPCRQDLQMLRKGMAAGSAYLKIGRGRSQ